MVAIGFELRGGVRAAREAINSFKLKVILVNKASESLGNRLCLRLLAFNRSHGLFCVYSALASATKSAVKKE